jgi:DNA polymerase-3 subunit epsilon
MTIAQRLGIDVTGRHTAIGDALATAKMFLKLLPLLAKKDILTLQAARQAAEKTYYARLKY